MQYIVMNATDMHLYLSKIISEI